MKRYFPVLISLVLAAGIVLAFPRSVQAFNWTPPVVTPVWGDHEFIASPTAVAKLPGIIPNDNGLVLPVGFPAGTAQFGGDGMVVKGLTEGSEARACFSMPPKSSSWAGSIFQWKGTKWVKLPTTINYGDVESTAATACAEIYGDGAYALIMGYTGKPEAMGLPVCSEEFEITGWGYQTYYPDYPMNPYNKWLQWIMVLGFNRVLDEGTPVTYSIFNFSPANAMQGALTRSAVVTDSSELGSFVQFTNGPDSNSTFPLTEWIISDHPISSIPFTLRITFPDCYMDVPNPFLGVGPSEEPQ